MHCAQCAVLLFICYTIFVNSDQTPQTIVTLPNGRILGHILTTPKGNSFLAFQEIPYATPPVGLLRFKDSIAPKNWDGILNTTSNTKVCFQSLPNKMENEDCLYLNVYTPITRLNGKMSNASSLPVLFYIFGGGFTKGDGTFSSLGPDFFIDQNIIVVTINYRLGAFGFLSTGDDIIPGNQALKDQNLALEWVNTNIRLFGGDPSKVTLMGESAGAASVGFHLLSKKSKGLFRAAIMESGSSICSWAYQSRAKLGAYKIATKLDPNFTQKNTSHDLLNLLQSVPASTIRDSNVTLETPFQIGQGYTWAPVIKHDHENAFITEAMHEVIKSGKANPVPLLIGINSEERITFASDLPGFKTFMAHLDKNVSLLVKEDFKINGSDVIAFGKALRSIYTNASFQEDFGAAIRFRSDARYTTAVLRHVDLQSKYSDVFLYQFSYYGMMGNIPSVYVEGAERVAHAADLGYLFSTTNNKDFSKFPASDVLTHNRLINLWANFVKYLHPTPTRDELFQNIDWPKVTANELIYLNINDTLDIRVDPRSYKSWKILVDTYGNPPFDTY